MNSTLEMFITVYIGIGILSLIFTGCYLLDYSIKGVDNFWDWVMYSIFWGIQPIKALIKMISNFFIK